MNIDLSKVSYIAMSGAQAEGARLHSIAENLANTHSIGYRSQIAQFMHNDNTTMPLGGVVVSTTKTNFSTGPLVKTDQPLDVAIENANGFFVVVDDEGGEALTRNGALKIDQNGQLRTIDNKAVLGTGGPIAIPPNTKITINKEGVISAISMNAANVVQVIGRIRLVSATVKNLVRGDDGLFRDVRGEATPVDPNITVRQGFIEMSNVSAPHELTEMIANSRSFEFQMRVIHEVSDREKDANQLLGLGR